MSDYRKNYAKARAILVKKYRTEFLEILKGLGTESTVSVEAKGKVDLVKES
jgi:hypothetical protein